MEADPPAPWGTKKEFFLLVDAKKKLARQILVKNVGAEKKKLASVLSRKFSWDRARAERAILRVFGPNRGGGVGPYEAQKVAKTRAENRAVKMMFLDRWAHPTLAIPNRRGHAMRVVLDGGLSHGNGTPKENKTF